MQVKDLQEETGGDLKEVGHAARMPGFTSGAPYWVQKVGWVGRWIGGIGEGLVAPGLPRTPQEVDARDEMPKASPSSFGNEAPPEPYAHFEAIRQAQKDRRKWGQTSKRVSLEV